jgi:membrane dipeptidase
VADWEKPLSETLKRITSAEESKQVQQEYAATHPKPIAHLVDVADQIEYIRKVAGVDHLGIGSDFFGGVEMPFGLEDTSKFPYLFAELIKRGWSDADLRKLAGGNILRVFREAEGVALRLQRGRPASTATIEELDSSMKK